MATFGENRKKKKRLKKTKSGDFVDKSTGLTENPPMNQNNLDEEKPKKKKKKKKLKKTEKGDIVDKSTGLTETSTSDQGEETEDAKKLREYQERTENPDKIKVRISKVQGKGQEASMTINDKSVGEYSDDKGESSDEYFEGKYGNTSTYDRQNRIIDIAERPETGKIYKYSDELDKEVKQAEERERLRKEAEEREKA